MRRAVSLSMWVACLLFVSSTATAADLLVTAHRDDPLAPVPGSLREVLSTAAPGDTLRFDVRHAVQLAADIEIGVDVGPVEIVGPVTLVGVAESGAALVIRGSGVRVFDLRTRDVVVRVESSADDTQVGGCRFEGPLGGVEVRGARRTLIGLPDAPNRFEDLEARGTPAISGLVLEDDSGTRVENNSFVGYQSGVRTRLSDGLVVRDNTFRDTGIEGEPRSATVERNRFTMRRGGNAVFLVDDPVARLPGRVTVSGNDVRSGPLGVDAIVVTREDAVVVANRVRARGQARRQRGIVVGMGHPYHLAPARAEIRDNEVSGTNVGVAYLTGREGAATVVITGNRVRGADGHGISASLPLDGSMTLEANDVARGRGYEDDAGIVAVSFGGSLELTSNSVRHNRVTGVQVHALDTSSMVVVRRNVVTANLGDGILVRQGPGYVSASENGVIANRGDGYHFDSGTTGTVSLSGGRLARNRGQPVAVEDGSYVAIID